MLHVAHVKSESRGARDTSRATTREHKYLTQLGEILGRCAEKLVCLALQDARRMASRPSAADTPDNTYQWAYFVGALTPTLDHTEIETQGVGYACRGGTEGSMAMAQALREMTK